MGRGHRLRLRRAQRLCWVLALASLALGGLAWLGLDYGARP
ncbi:hypothetical protein K652_07631 [Pseudomonas aeruginosa VRFPA02]|nr:hypothetical protein K652_07631 [Pseudomonas aeruginosa VRFPA02]